MGMRGGACASIQDGKISVYESNAESKPVRVVKLANVVALRPSSLPGAAADAWDLEYSPFEVKGGDQAKSSKRSQQLVQVLGMARLAIVAKVPSAQGTPRAAAPLHWPAAFPRRMCQGRLLHLLHPSCRLTLLPRRSHIKEAENQG